MMVDLKSLAVRLGVNTNTLKRRAYVLGIQASARASRGRLLFDREAQEKLFVAHNLMLAGADMYDVRLVLAQRDLPTEEAQPADEPRVIESFPVRSCENGANKPVIAQVTDRQAVGQAFEAGRRHERERAAKVAKPCVFAALARLDGPDFGEAVKRAKDDERPALVLLLAAVAEAKRAGVDLATVAKEAWMETPF